MDLQILISSVFKNRRPKQQLGLSSLQRHLGERKMNIRHFALFQFFCCQNQNEYNTLFRPFLKTFVLPPQTKYYIRHWTLFFLHFLVCKKKIIYCISPVFKNYFLVCQTIACVIFSSVFKYYFPSAKKNESTLFHSFSKTIVWYEKYTLFRPFSKQFCSAQFCSAQCTVFLRPLTKHSRMQRTRFRALLKIIFCWRKQYALHPFFFPLKKILL